MAKLTVMCARSMHLAVGALGREFSETSGHELEFDFGTVGVLQARIDAAVVGSARTFASPSAAPCRTARPTRTAC